MSYAEAQYIPLSDKQGSVFQGGIVDNSEPNLIPTKCTPFGRNFRVNGQGISKRPGFIQRALLSNTVHDYAKGIGVYLRNNPSNDSIVVNFPYSATQQLLSINPTTYAVTPITTASDITSSNRMRFSSANDSLYCMNGSDLYGKLNGTTYSAISTGNTVYNPDTGTAVNDLTVTYGAVGHVFNIAITSTASPNKFAWNVDGGAYTTNVSIIAGPMALAFGTSITWGATTGHILDDTWVINTGFVPSFGVWFDNSMFVAGDPAFPSRIYKSSTNNPESFSGSGADIFDTKNPVVGLAASGQTLYVFTESTIDMINNNSIKQVGSTLVYTSVPLEATEGAVNFDSIISIGKDCLYLSKSNKIRRIQPQGVLHYNIQELSHAKYEGINKTMATLDPDQTQSFAYHVPEKQIVKWHCKKRGSNFNDICITYNYEYDEWMVDSNKVFNGGVWYKTKAYSISQIEPKLYEDEYGTSDDGTPIEMEYWTKRLDYGNPTINKEIWESRTFLKINSLANVEQNTWADGNQVDTYTINVDDIANLVDGIATEPIGTYAIGEDGIPAENSYNLSIIREKGDLQVRAKYFMVQFKEATLGAEVLLQRYEQRIQMLSQLTTSTN